MSFKEKLRKLYTKVEAGIDGLEAKAVTLGRAMEDRIASVVEFVEERHSNVQRAVAVEQALKATRLTAEQIADLEQQVKVNSDDAQLRVSLLGALDEQPDKAFPHLMWFIENRPEHPILSSGFALNVIARNPNRAEDAKNAFRKQMASRGANATLCIIAAELFWYDDRPFAAEMARAAVQLKPNDKRIRHAAAYTLRHCPGCTEEASSNKRVAIELETDPYLKWHEMIDLPEFAIAAGELQIAKECADQVLELLSIYRSRGDYGDAINRAHTALGRIALRNGDIESARYHLGQSCIDIASAVNCSFGPELHLVEDFINFGYPQYVFDYLDAHEKLAGPDDDEAFDLRLKALTGQSKETIGELEWTRRYCERQLQCFRMWNYDAKQQHISDCIQSAERNLQFLKSDPYERRDENVELVRLYEDHIKKLKACARRK
jgi:hypothetical protein